MIPLKQILLAGVILLLALPANAAPTANGLQGGRNNAGWNNGGGYSPSEGGDQGSGGWFENLSKGQMDQLEKDFKQREKDKGKQSQQGTPGKSYNEKQQERERNGWSKF